MGAFDEDVVRPGVPLWLMVLGACLGGVAYFWVTADHVAAGSLAALTITGFGGYRMGAARLCAWVGGLAVAAVYAPRYADGLEPHTAAFFGGEGDFNRLLALLVTGAAMMLGVQVSVRLIAYVLLRERLLLQWTNKWAGFSLGIAQGVALTLLVLGAIQIVEPSARQRLRSRLLYQRSDFGGVVAKRMVQLAELTRDSVVAPWVEAYNPFERIEQLERMQRSLKELADHDPIRRWAGGQDATQLHSTASIMRMLHQLRDDPQLNEILDTSVSVDH